MARRRWQPPHPAAHVERRACPAGDRFASWGLAHAVTSALGLAGWGVGHPVECGGCGGWHVSAGAAPEVAVPGAGWAPVFGPHLPPVVDGRPVVDLALPEPGAPPVAAVEAPSRAPGGPQGASEASSGAGLVPDSPVASRGRTELPGPPAKPSPPSNSEALSARLSRSDASEVPDASHLPNGRLRPLPAPNRGPNA